TARLGAVALLVLGAALAGCGDDDAPAADTEREQERSPGGAGDGGDGGGDDGDGGERGDGDGGQGDDGGSGVGTLEPAELSPEAEPYADALAGALAGTSPFDGLEDEQARCVATNYVALIGVDRFVASGVTPEDVGRDPADLDADSPELDL